jgi:hypothetical protein
MQNLQVYFKVPFSNPELSDERLAKGAEVHIARTSANNPGGKYTVLIAATTTKAAAFSQALSAKHFLHSEKEGTTKTEDEFIAEFKKMAQDTHGLISYTFKDNPAAYEDFYPHGVTEYTKINKTTAFDLMNNLAKACLKHAASLPDDFGGQFDSVLASFIDARNVKESKVGEIKGKQDERTSTRVALEDQLMDNLLTIAKDYKRQPEKCETYFELSLMKPYCHKKRGSGAPNGDDTDTDVYVLAILALTTSKAEFSIAAGETYTFYNPGEVTLSIYAALTEDAPLPATAIAIAPGEEKTLKVEDLGPAGSAFLLVNNSTTVGGSIEISLI